MSHLIWNYADANNKWAASSQENAFKDVPFVQIQIILCMRKVSSGHLVSFIHSVVSNDAVTEQWRLVWAFAVCICPKTVFTWHNSINRWKKHFLLFSENRIWHFIQMFSLEAPLNCSFEMWIWWQHLCLDKYSHHLLDDTFCSQRILIVFIFLHESMLWVLFRRVLQIIIFPVSMVLVKFKASQYRRKHAFWNQYPCCWHS